MNLYITGLNQVTDIEIDKVNKPYLPIAAGDLSKKNGIFIVLASLLASLCNIGTFTSHQSHCNLIASFLYCFSGNMNWPLQAVVVGSGKDPFLL